MLDEIVMSSEDRFGERSVEQGDDLAAGRMGGGRQVIQAFVVDTSFTMELDGHREREYLGYHAVYEFTI